MRSQLTKGASTNALLRTTTALTVVQAGEKDNVMPGQALATVNFRLLPGDTIADVQAHVGAAVDNPAVTVTARSGGAQASVVSPTSAEAYQLIARTVRELFPGTIVAPGLMIGATDSRHFQAISDHLYRFSPVRASAPDLKRFHGTDERIAEDNLADLIRFYQRLLRLEPVSAGRSQTNVQGADNDGPDRADAAPAAASSRPKFRLRWLPDHGRFARCACSAPTTTGRRGAAAASTWASISSISRSAKGCRRNIPGRRRRPDVAPAAGAIAAARVVPGAALPCSTSYGAARLVRSSTLCTTTVHWCGEWHAATS
ncbi:MAG: M20/M25/M40 family metallo-hydrolase [Burkholderiaceae bacterium]